MVTYGNNGGDDGFNDACDSRDDGVDGATDCRDDRTLRQANVSKYMSA